MDANQPVSLEDFYDNKMCILREQQNARCSKTKNLPPEILLSIFGALEYEFRHSHGYRPNWWAVTHVCRTWRDTALSEPTLWTDFTDSKPHPGWTQEVFARSKAAPLILSVNFDRGFADRVAFIFDHLVEHPERIKELTVLRTHFDGSLFLKPAPYLESLAIHSRSADIPTDFLGGIAPRLQHLWCSKFKLPREACWLTNLRTLRCLRVHPEATYLSKLTELWLNSRNDASDSDTSMDTILSALENMPLLRKLNLQLSSHWDHTPSRRTTPVHLPHLSDITAFAFCAPAMAKILDHLSVNNIERLHTTWPDHFQDTTMVEPVLHFFNRCFHGSDLCYLLRETHNMEIGRFSDSTGVYTPVLTLKNFEQRNLARVMKLIHCFVPRIFETDQIWHSSARTTLTLRKCDTIEELRMRPRSEVGTLFEVDVNDTSPPYPSLLRLRFEEVTFFNEDSLIPLLKRWLAGRTPKIKLHLSDCRISEADVESLRETAFVTSYHTPRPSYGSDSD